jgi:copper homeostasis protein
MSTINFKTEVCIDAVDMARQAEKAGAGRLELCVSLVEGGITPSFSLIEKVCKSVHIPVHVMVRPRAGDFYYTEDEFELMKTDIKHAHKAKAAGVVFGILNHDGTIDVERCRELKAIASPMHVTFHRAFDLTPDPFLALEEVITLGFHSILTSGQAQTAEDGLELIRELIKRAENRIEIMAGSGVNSNTVKLLKEAGVTTYHFTCRKKMDTGSGFVNKAIQSLSSNKSVNAYDMFTFDEEKFKSITSALTTQETV